MSNKADKQDELEHYYRQGKDHFERGTYVPPSSRLHEYVRFWDNTTIDEADSAYNAGHSKGGQEAADKKGG